MICLILTMAGGLCAGYILRKCKWLVHIGKAISVTICLMLFIMGIKIGENDSILMNFTTLGWQAFVLAMASLAGSVVFSAILYRLIVRRKPFTEDKADRCASGIHVENGNGAGR